MGYCGESWSPFACVRGPDLVRYGRVADGLELAVERGQRGPLYCCNQLTDERSLMPDGDMEQLEGKLGSFDSLSLFYMFYAYSPSAVLFTVSRFGPFSSSFCFRIIVFLTRVM